MQSIWAQEHSQALREHLERGLSYAEIANAINERFNTDYTRNAAIGRARRMGLSGTKQSASRMRSTIPPQPSLARLSKLRARGSAGFRHRPAVLRRAAALRLRCIGIAPRHLSLLELEDGDCRYPYGGDRDGEAITFCGHPRREGSSYCTSHFHLTSGLPERDCAARGGPAVGRAHLRLVEAA
jgi:GcrA cell cycle regulator